MAIKTIESGTVADAYLALLADRGIDYLFANAGTDFAPIIEAYAKAQAHGTKVPKPVTVPHENVAIAMAQGYYLQTGRPQAVMVHVNVGTANALCGLINGWRGNIPVLFTVRAHALFGRGRPSRRAQRRDSLAAGNARSARHGARIRQMGLRASQRPGAGIRRRPRAQHRDDRAARAPST